MPLATRERNGSIFTQTGRVTDYARERPAIELVQHANMAVHPIKPGTAMFDR